MTLEEHTNKVLDAVRSEWHAAEEFAVFIGPPCPICSRRACRDDLCLAAIRESVRPTVGEMARVLGVTQPPG